MSMQELKQVATLIHTHSYQIIIHNHSVQGDGRRVSKRGEGTKGDDEGRETRKRRTETQGCCEPPEDHSFALAPRIAES